MNRSMFCLCLALATAGCTGHPAPQKPTSDTREAETSPAPPGASTTPPVPLDPAKPTALDYFTGSWTCDGWLSQDDASAHGVRIDVTREPSAKPVYAIAYSWTVSTASKQICRLPLSANANGLHFPLEQQCVTNFRGTGPDAWTGDELSISLFENPATPRIPEDEDHAPMTGTLRFVRHGSNQFEILYLAAPPIHCSKV